MEIISGSVRKTIAVGKFISRNLEKGDIVCLFGELGSGKTVLAKGISSGLGVRQESVTSPTFVLIRQYKARIPVFHFDLYRLVCPEDILDLGYEEYLFGEGISIIEWADRLGKLLPSEFLKVQLKVAGENKRQLKISARGTRYKKIMGMLRENFSH